MVAMYHYGKLVSYYSAIIISPVCVLSPQWNMLLSAFLILTSVLSLFYEHFPSDWDNLLTSLYEHDLNQGIKTTRFHGAMESIDGSPEKELKSRQINSFTRKGRYHISYWCRFTSSLNTYSNYMLWKCYTNTTSFWEVTAGSAEIKNLTLQSETVGFRRNGISTSI